MYSILKNKFNNFDLEWRKSLERFDGSRKQYASAKRHAFWMDHEILRALYHNQSKVAPGVYRSNQPSPNRIKTWAKKGIKTIINLRGASNQGSYLLELQKCNDLGIKLINYPLYATRLASSDELIGLGNLFEKINYPILLHCKSGADRAGLASVMYHLMVLDTPFQIARKHLSIRFLHLKFSRSGILDFMLDTYEKESKMTGLNFRSWIETKYDPNKLTKIYRG